MLAAVGVDPSHPRYSEVSREADDAFTRVLHEDLQPWEKSSTVYGQTGVKSHPHGDQMYEDMGVRQMERERDDLLAKVQKHPAYRKYMSEHLRGSADDALEHVRKYGRDKELSSDVDTYQELDKKVRAAGRAISKTAEHRYHVDQAIAEGKEVPKHVLDEYKAPTSLGGLTVGSTWKTATAGNIATRKIERASRMTPESPLSFFVSTDGSKSHQILPVSEIDREKELDESRAANHVRDLKARLETLELEEKDRRAREDLSGFDEKMSPLQRARAVGHLDKYTVVDGNNNAIREHIKDMVKQGAKVEEPTGNPYHMQVRGRWVEGVDSHRKLTTLGGTQLSEKVIGATGIEFAKHLIAKRDSGPLWEVPEELKKYRHPDEEKIAKMTDVGTLRSLRGMTADKLDQMGENVTGPGWHVKNSRPGEAESMRKVDVGQAYNRLHAIDSRLRELSTPPADLPVQSIDRDAWLNARKAKEYHETMGSWPKIRREWVQEHAKLMQDAVASGAPATSFHPDNLGESESLRKAIFARDEKKRFDLAPYTPIGTTDRGDEIAVKAAHQEDGRVLHGTYFRPKGSNDAWESTLSGYKETPEEAIERYVERHGADTTFTHPHAVKHAEKLRQQRAAAQQAEEDRRVEAERRQSKAREWHAALDAKVEGMKGKKGKATLRGADGDAVGEREGTVFGEHFLVHKTHPDDPSRQKFAASRNTGYIVTHIPTGSRIAEVASATQGKQVTAALLGTGVDWSLKDQSGEMEKHGEKAARARKAAMGWEHPDDIELGKAP